EPLRRLGERNALRRAQTRHHVLVAAVARRQPLEAVGRSGDVLSGRGAAPAALRTVERMGSRTDAEVGLAAPIGRIVPCPIPLAGIVRDLVMFVTGGGQRRVHGRELAFA